MSKIKACYLRLQGSFFSPSSSLAHLSLSPLPLPLPPSVRPSVLRSPSFSFQRLVCQGAIERRQCVLNSDQRRKRRKAFLMTGIHSPFLIHLSSYPLLSPSSFPSPFRPPFFSLRASVIIGEVLVTANEITI